MELGVVGFCVLFGLLVVEVVVRPVVPVVPVVPGVPVVPVPDGGVVGVPPLLWLCAGISSSPAAAANAITFTQTFGVIPPPNDCPYYVTDFRRLLLTAVRAGPTRC